MHNTSILVVVDDNTLILENVDTVVEADSHLFNKMPRKKTFAFV